MMLKKAHAGLGVLLLIVFWFLIHPSSQKPITTLLRPPTALASTEQSFLENEAGITAYAQLPIQIEFFYIRGLFHTIEYETADYLIGSLDIPQYGVLDAPHIYVHQSGWVVAYYLNTEPASKALDWKNYTPGEDIATKLQIAIETVTDALQTVAPTIDYYDFRYPDATHLMVIMESADTDGNGSNPYQINLPQSYTYYEYSWLLGTFLSWYTSGSLHLDGQQIARQEVGYGDPAPANSFGYYSAAQMAPNVFHTITVEAVGATFSAYAVGGLALVYQENP